MQSNSFCDHATGSSEIHSGQTWGIFSNRRVNFSEFKWISNIESLKQLPEKAFRLYLTFWQKWVIRTSGFTNRLLRQIVNDKCKLWGSFLF